MRRRLLAAILVSLIAWIGNLACHAASTEPVKFASARVKLGPLTARACCRGPRTNATPEHH